MQAFTNSECVGKMPFHGLSMEAGLSCVCSAAFLVVTEPHEFTSFCFPFLFSNHWFIILLRATHVFKPQLEVFLSASATQISLPTTLQHTQCNVSAHRDFIQSSSCNILHPGLPEQQQLWWRCVKGSELWHQCDVEVTLIYVPRRIHSHAIAGSCWVQIKNSK